MVPVRRGPCQCIRRAMASGDAHVSHAVRRVHDHTSGRGILVEFASGQTLRQRLPIRIPYLHTGWPSSLGVVPGVARNGFSSQPGSEVRSELQLVQETFGECPEGADDETVRRYARAYIMMLLSTQLFADKSGNRIHIRWLPYVARLEEMGTYSWGSAALAWLYRCMCRVANRHVVKLAGPLQLLQS
ncbi:uncharacterized protein DS421_5g141620 [Arachis hypogaea]|nr:uncharacterized protein DS421_5g141620 [Arachis hypogaea]